MKKRIKALNYPSFSPSTNLVNSNNSNDFTSSEEQEKPLDNQCETTVDTSEGYLEADQTQVKSFGTRTDAAYGATPNAADIQAQTIQTDTTQPPVPADSNKPKKKINAKKIGIVAVIIVAASLFVFFFIHDWTEANCIEPETCSICHATRGEALGHDWSPATYTKPRTCSRCRKTEGSELGYEWSEWTIEKESTCTVKGTETRTCTRCEKNSNSIS